MLTRSMVRFALGATLALVALPERPALAQLAAESPTAEKPKIVRRIDHVLILASDSGRLFRFLTETLKLPVAWPVDRYRCAPYFDFESGGASAGNANIEVLRDPGQRQAGPLSRFVGFGSELRGQRAMLWGFAFEPVPLADAIAELDRRHIAHSPPRAFTSRAPSGSARVEFTNVYLEPSFAGAFFNEYPFDETATRMRLGRQLAQLDGGPLGIRAIAEVMIVTPDYPAAVRRWQELLLPEHQSAPGLWRLGDGPAVHLVAAKAEHEALTLQVGSLARARAFLEKAHLLGAVSQAQLTIDPAAIDGIDLRLRE